MSWFVKDRRKLASGGFAEIYIGVRSDTGEQVVVKYLRESDNPEYRRTFAREFRILKRRLHERVVTVLGGDPDAERPYYIMPFYGGGKLTNWAGRLNHEQLQVVATQLAEALLAFHKAEIAHGDFKPDNVLVGEGGDLRVADPLGNGAGCTVLYAANRGGTPGYWAPEVAKGGPISRPGDVFSFGATLYHMATGRAPQDGQTLDPQAIGALVPKHIRAIILVCCRPDPASRPRLSQVLTMLQKRLTELPVTPKSDPLADLLKAAAIAGCFVAGVALVARMMK